MDEEVGSPVQRSEEELDPNSRDAIRAAHIILAVISSVMVGLIAIGYTRAQKPAKEAIANCLEQLPDVCAVLSGNQIAGITECAVQKVRDQLAEGKIGESSLIPHTGMVLEAMRDNGNDMFLIPDEEVEGQ